MALVHLEDNRYKGFRAQMAWGLIGFLVIIVGCVFLYLRSEQQKREDEAERQAERDAAVAYVVANTPVVPPSLPVDATALRTQKLEQLRGQMRTEAQNREWMKIDELARQILALEPQDGEAWNYLALVSEKGGDYKGAAEAYTKALEGKYIPSFTLLKRASMYRQLGNYPAAVRDLQEAALLDPGSTSVPNLLLIAQIQAGDIEKVRQAVANYDSVGLETTANQYLLGKAALALHDGQTAKAAEILAQYRELVPIAVFAELLEDPFFTPYRNKVELLPFYLKN